MNINSINAIRLCTSCQMCSAVCPKSAITIELDTYGFYRPMINNSLCIECGLCTQVCYKFDQSIIITSQEELNSMSLYAASAKDDDLVYKTTSGGIADLLAKELIVQGYSVIGVTYDYEKDRAVSRIATSKQEINSFRGSKYIQSFTADAFRELVLNSKNQKFAVFGLPCHIYAINRYLSKHNLRENFVLIDLYCHGCPSMLLWDKMCATIKSKMNIQQFDLVNFRGKSKGWGQFVIEARSGKKRYRTTPMHNEFYDLFFSNQILNKSCTDCQLRSTLAYSDIRLGDFWGKKFNNNSRGISGISVVTPIGKLFFSKIRDHIYFKLLDHSIFLPYQSWGIQYRVNKELQEELFSFLKDEKKSIKDVANIINQNQGMVISLKKLVKQLLFLLKNK